MQARLCIDQEPNRTDQMRSWHSPARPYRRETADTVRAGQSRASPAAPIGLMDRSRLPQDQRPAVRLRPIERGRMTPVFIAPSGLSGKGPNTVVPLVDVR